MKVEQLIAGEGWHLTLPLNSLEHAEIVQKNQQDRHYDSRIVEIEGIGFFVQYRKPWECWHSRNTKVPLSSS